MYLEFIIHYEKNNGKEIEEWKSSSNLNMENNFLVQFTGLMKSTINNIKSISNSKKFVRLLKLVIIQDKNIVMIIKSKMVLKNEPFINIEYLLQFDWKKIKKNTLCKIIVANFSSLLITMNQNEKNSINNLSKIIDNDVEALKISIFKAQIIEIDYKIDSPNIKSNHFKTPIKFRGYN